MLKLQINRNYLILTWMKRLLIVNFIFYNQSHFVVFKLRPYRNGSRYLAPIMVLLSYGLFNLEFRMYRDSLNWCLRGLTTRQCFLYVLVTRLSSVYNVLHIWLEMKLTIEMYNIEITNKSQLMNVPHSREWKCSYLIVNFIFAIINHISLY